MRIGILEAGRNRDRLLHQYGTYPDMFKAFLTREEPSLRFASYAALDGELPAAAEECDAWLITGSRYSAFERQAWMLRLESFLRELMQKKRPLVGICFGHQILAQAMGGTVARASVGWGLGIHTYRVRETAPWMKTKPETLSLCVVHQDQVTDLPKAARVLAESPFCPAAILAYDDHALTFQAHPEFTPRFVHDLVDELAAAGPPEAVLVRARAELEGPAPHTDSALAARWILDFLAGFSRGIKFHPFDSSNSKGQTMTLHTLSERRAAAIARGVGVTTSIFAARAENAEIWDFEGRRYIDFAAGIAVTNTGHRHPAVMAAVKAQLERFTHTCHQVVPYENYVILAERLNALVPGDFPKKTIFVTTGAEAVENSVKIARAATGRSGIVAFSGAFHGRTFLGMSLTGKVVPYKAGFGPLVNEVYHVPFPVEAHGITVDQTLTALERLFKVDIEPSRLAAILLEPVQGEGGFYPAPPALMTSLRAICDQYGILLLADEVQTGFARTGHLFAMERYGVAADITAMAKGLGGGFPLAAVTGRAAVMDAVAPGGLGGTYAGNPVAIAAANAVLDVIAGENLAARAEALGGRLKQRLEGIREKAPQIADIRGPGLMVATEFAVPGTGAPDANFAGAVRAKALEKGLILLTCGIYGNVIRFLPPLTISDALFTEALDLLEAAILAAAGKSN